MSTKVSIVGAGALGSLLGGLLTHRAPDLDVLLVGRGTHGEALRRRGQVWLRGPWGEYRVTVRFSDKVADVAGSDLVVFTVKSHATETAIRETAPHLGAAPLVSIQNGINARLLTPHVPARQLIAGMYAGNVAIVEPGVVSQQLDGVILLGPASPGKVTPAATMAAALLRRTGLRVHTHPNVLGAQCNKLAVNVLGYAAAMSRSNFITEGILHGPWRRGVALPLLKECLAVFRKAGIRLAPIPGVTDIDSFRFLLFLFGVPLVGRVGGRILRFIFNRKRIVFSLQLDIERCKPTEIDFINGEIVRQARELDVPTPCNEKVVHMVHELEKRGDGTFFSREEVIERLR